MDAMSLFKSFFLHSQVLVVLTITFFLGTIELAPPYTKYTAYTIYIELAPPYRLYKNLK